MESIALYAGIILIILIIVFHVCVLLRMIPYDKIWGGRISSLGMMYILVCTSLLILGFILLLFLAPTGLLGQVPIKQEKNYHFWLLAIFFFLNAIGNLFSKSKLEKTVFTPMAALLSIISAYLAL